MLGQQEPTARGPTQRTWMTTHIFVSVPPPKQLTSLGRVFSSSLGPGVGVHPGARGSWSETHRCLLPLQQFLLVPAPRSTARSLSPSRL